MSFDAYEDEVLELLEGHGGRMIVRLRGVDRPIETHVLTFPSRTSYQNYLNDPHRLILQPLFEKSGVKKDVWEAEEPDTLQPDIISDNLP